jgi:RNA polymerase sigma-70 factor (ECF subfamily)
MDETDDAADWARVLAGDGEAFGRIFDRRAAQVRRQARRLLDRPADVEDAVAVVFLEAWRRRTAVTVVDGSLLPWLLVTATNVARNIRRGRARYDGLLSRLPAPPPAPDPSAAFDEQHLVDAMRALSLADQQVLTLCVLEGWSERDAAAALQVAPGTVKSRLHRAKQRLALRVTRAIDTPQARRLTHGA